MPPVFTINGRPAAELGVTSATLTYRTQAADTCELVLAAPLAATPLAGEVEIVVDRARLVGEVRAPSRGAMVSPRHAVTVEGKWADLEKTIVQFPRPFDGYQGLDSRVLVGGRWVRDSNDPGSSSRPGFRIEPMAVRNALARVGDFVDVRIEGGPTEKVPPREADAITASEYIKALLRWFPGATAAFDGRADRLEIQTTVGGVAPLEVRAGTIDGVPSLRRNDDAALAGVKLILCREEQSTYGSREEIFTHVAGKESGKNVLVVRIDLMPRVHLLTAAALQLRAIQEDRRAWWVQRDEYLAALAANDVTISGPHDLRVDREHESLRTEVQGGSVPEVFMRRGCSGPYREDQLPKIFGVSNGLRPVVGRVTLLARFEIASGDNAVDVWRVLELTATNLSPATSDGDSFLLREDRDAYDPGESPEPYRDLPAQVLASSRALAWEGSVSFLPAEVPGSVIGRPLVVPFFNGADRLETNTPITQMSVDCMRGRVTVNVGFPGYLGPADLAEKIRMIQGRRPRRARRGEVMDQTAPPPGSGQQSRPARGTPGKPVTYGRVKVEITPPEAVEAGAAWFAKEAKGESPLGPYVSGKFQPIPAGSYTIYFQDVTGYTRPAALSRRILNGGSETIKGTDAEYAVTTAGAKGPFSLELRKRSASGGWEARFALESHLFADLEERIAITGLNTWTAISGGRRIFLQGKFDDEGDLIADTVTISDVAEGGEWPLPVVIVPETPSMEEAPRQTEFNRRLAEIVFDDKGVPSVRYFTTTHLLLQYLRHRGNDVLFPVAM